MIFIRAVCCCYFSYPAALSLLFFDFKLRAEPAASPADSSAALPDHSPPERQKEQHSDPHTLTHSSAHIASCWAAWSDRDRPHRTTVNEQRPTVPCQWHPVQPASRLRSQRGPLTSSPTPRPPVYCKQSSIRSLLPFLFPLLPTSWMASLQSLPLGQPAAAAFASLPPSNHAQSARTATIAHSQQQNMNEEQQMEKDGQRGEKQQQTDRRQRVHTVSAASAARTRRVTLSPFTDCIPPLVV